MTTSKEDRLRSYDSIGEFFDGVACASQGDDFFHIREEDGAPLYEERYITVCNFRHGRALVGLVGPDGNLWFHIGLDGSPAYEERYKWVGEFRGSDPTALVLHDGDQFEIRPDGSRVE